MLIIAIGIFIRKIQCQLVMLNMPLAIIGPRIGIITAGIAIVAMAVLKYFRPTDNNKTDCMAGIRIPAPTPCIARENISIFREEASLHNREPSIKTNNPINHTERLPNHRIDQVHKGITTAADKVYIIATHCSFATDAPKKSPKLGMEMPTIVASKRGNALPKSKVIMMG